MKKEDKEIKSINDLIIDEAVKQFKEGKIKNSLDVEDYLDSLLQPLMQKLLDAELENHLEYSKYTHLKGKKDANIRNGYCKTKNVKTKYGNIKIRTPRDRNATFNPVIIEKGQTTLPGFEDKCIALYAKGMSVRDIEKTLKEIYGVKINKDQITMLISAVNEETEKWRKRKLKPLYVFTYADCLYVPIKDDLTTSKKAVYVIIGVDAEGYKDILGLWIDGTESASFWNNVFEDLKERGVEDILYMSSDGIAGFKGSLERVFPRTQSQRCVVHLVRNIYSLCPKKEAKNIIADYKKIYISTSLEEASLHLKDFKDKYEKDHKRIVKKVEDFMQYLEPLFELPDEIRKCIYTSNAVESVNSALRKVTRGKGAFPNENSVFKILFLRVRELKERWNKPIQKWKTIRSQLTDLFGERYTKHLEI
ncbi:MAG: IS256 family transposase [Clostridia bacterium]|nr:IS256 family transposase [Clostridia bacterium]